MVCAHTLIILNFALRFWVFSEANPESKCENGNELKRRKSQLLLDSSDFKTLRLSGCVFVDKSEMINEYFQRGGAVLIINKPGKWGKSVNLSMFKYFFGIEVDESGGVVSEENRTNRVLFTGGVVNVDNGTVKKLGVLKITQFLSAMEQQGTSPVILFSLRSVDGDTYEEFENALVNTMSTLYRTYPFLNFKNDTEPITNVNEEVIESFIKRNKLENSLYMLSKMLFRHFKRNVYILIDDYDLPMTKMFLKFSPKSEIFIRTVDLLYSMIKRALKGNMFMERAILTGTFHFTWIDDLVGLSDARHSIILDTTFSSFYGFTEKEINEILEKVPTEIHQDQIKEWYNGYNFDNVMTYNPWSTLASLERGHLALYWRDVQHQQTTDQLMDRVYMTDSAQDYLHQLLQGKVITRKEIHKPVNLANIEDTFHRILLFGGYVNSEPAFCENTCYIHPWNLSLPNREVKGIIAGGVAKWTARLVNVSGSEYHKLTGLFVNKEIGSFSKLLQQYVASSRLPKVRASEQQQMYHLLVSGLLTSLAGTHTVESCRTLGQRTREYTLTPYPDTGHDLLIMEYELSKAPKRLTTNVETGFNRLINRVNDTIKLKSHKHIKQITKIYMVVCRKKLALKYEIHDVR